MLNTKNILMGTTHSKAENVKRLEYAGHFDGVVGRVAFGWATLNFDEETPVEVEILAGKYVVSKGLANLAREDLAELGHGQGRFGFRCLLPIELFNGKNITVSARIKGYKDSLPGGAHKIAKNLSSLSEAFNEDSVATSEPLSDYQVVMLKSVAAICDALTEQTKQLKSLSHKSDHPLSEHRNTSSVQKSPERTIVDEFRASKHRGDVLVFSIIDWNFRVQRPQHLSSMLGKIGFRVTYISVHLAEHKAGGGRFFLASKPDANVYELKLTCAAPIPSVYSGIEKPEQIQALCRGIDDMMTILGIQSPLAIVQYPTWFPVVSSIPGATIIHDCLDHIGGFSTTGKQVLNMERDLMRNADLVVTSSQYLFTEASKYCSPKIIRNGAEVEFLACKPNRINKFEGPVIGYFGAIAEWFDVNLIKHAAQKRPSYNFVLIGSTHGAKIKELKKLDNVTFIGEIPYAEIPSYLHAFDVGIIPFKLNELTRATNPVKLYEYFAAGIPVVTTNMPEIRQAPENLVRISLTSDEFVSAIDSAIDEGEGFKAERQAWGFNQTWLQRAYDLIEAVNHTFPRVSIVVLTFNNLAFTKACLESIEKYSQYQNLEVICVDNASDDGSVEYLEAWAKQGDSRKLILNKKNLGFAEGNNVGIRAATGEFLILLNNDTYVTPGWVRDLIRPLQRNSKIGLVGPVTNAIGNEQKIKINYANMSEMILYSRLFTIGRKLQYFEPTSLAFFCVAIPRKVIDIIGLLDSEFGLGYFEDDDYCQRARRAGFALCVAEGVFVHHHLSASFGADPPLREKLIRKNKKIYESRWGKWVPHRYRKQEGYGE